MIIDSRAVGLCAYWNCPLFLDQALTSTFGTCRIVTSRYLLTLAEATTMYAQGALLFGDGLLDGWTYGMGDGAGVYLGSGHKKGGLFHMN